MATPRLTGTARTKATSEEARVPYANVTAPKTLWTGSHRCVQRNPAPKRAIAGQAAMDNWMIIEATMTTTANPNAVNTARNTASVQALWRRTNAAPGGRRASALLPTFEGSIVRTTEPYGAGRKAWP